ncbi:MAG: sulfatase-like hydrolase/transferase [Acidimicrobiales bacterium]|nr:sulfatase-like hydrolase/transferase [Acidimicrobiales bacterium]MXX43429.1 sulfatase-like hydrolase/transferase [Acidimicrobiales bacterium]MYB82401.1 sulfatase-like hydrolase/transferase [Acidimicrobiales bacterium]MYD34200.1 sulfatase-like hydrolase/transferase [Acidimicrobiales bacterium]MYI08961.1 sulfatase-like hydrolase/transferase [Acidimicrobiales bacterium]
MTAAANGAASQPNVLFIITDQQRADHVGFASNDVVRTPNLDALAARGMVFDNAWVANPVCMPNRSTIMTGRMPSSHGVVFNDRSLEPGANTHVRQFKNSGYRTALVGKSHLQHGMSRNAVIPSDLAGGPVDEYWPKGWDTLEDADRYLGGAPEFPDSFYGFSHVELAIDHGARASGHHLLWALDRGGRMEDLYTPLSAESPFRRRSDRWWQVYEPPYDPELHSSSFVADRTIDFITDAVSAGEPWLAWASFPDPHHPMSPPGEWFERHRPEDMELPASVDDPMERAPRYLQAIRNIHPRDQRHWVAPCGVAGDHDLLREAIAATYGMIELIDDRVGRILAALDRLGQTDNTIIVFTADHGDMMGDHGLMLKGYMHYRGTLAVPMVIVDPRRAPGRTQSLAGSIDLGPTLMELAGVTPFAGMSGRSLVPVLDDASAAVREEVLIEDDFPGALVTKARLPAKTRSLVTADMRLTRHSSGEEQLFDTAADPHELSPLGRSDPARRAEMYERLVEAMMEADDLARGMPMAVNGATRAPSRADSGSLSW